MRAVEITAGTAVLLFVMLPLIVIIIYPVMLHLGQWGREVSFVFAIDVAVRGFAISEIV